MKIAVVYTGLVRPEKELYADNIWKIKTMLPNADFFFTTWKGYEEYDWIDHYFDEPKLHYNCDYKLQKEAIAQMRTLDKSHPKYIKQRNMIKYRSKGRNLIKQHLGYMLAFDKFVKFKGYDIAIRIRYDLKYSKDFITEDLQKAIELVYETKRPLGIGILDPNVFPPGEISNVKDPFQSLADFFIIHSTNHFHTDYGWKLFENKKLKGGECGWYQLMCDQQFKESYVANHMWAMI